jgi:hypothetical protein
MSNHDSSPDQTNGWFGLGFPLNGRDGLNSEDCSIRITYIEKHWSRLDAANHVLNTPRSAGLSLKRKFSLYNQKTYNEA